MSLRILLDGHSSFFRRGPSLFLPLTLLQSKMRGTCDTIPTMVDTSGVLWDVVFYTTVKIGVPGLSGSLEGFQWVPEVWSLNGKTSE